MAGDKQRSKSGSRDNKKDDKKSFERKKPERSIVQDYKFGEKKRDTKFNDKKRTDGAVDFSSSGRGGRGGRGSDRGGRGGRGSDRGGRGGSSSGRGGRGSENFERGGKRLAFDRSKSNEPRKVLKNGQFEEVK